MATGLKKSQASSSARSVVAYDEYVDQQLGKVMSYVRLSDLATGLLGIATFLIATFLLLALVDHWLFDLGRVGRLLGLVAIGTGVLFGLLRLIVPLFTRRVNPAYAAHVIEEGEPQLKNGLLNYIFLRRDPRGLREIVYSAVEQQAATKLSQVDVETVIDHTPVVRTGIALAGLVVAFGLYLLISPKNPLQTAKRVVLPWADAPRPSRVRILEVQPGDTEIYAGRHVTISAQIENLAARDEVELIYNSLDGQIVDRRTVMSREDDGLQFDATIPETPDGLFQDLTYRITAGDAEAGPFRIQVKPTPSLNVREILYEYPAYTNKTPTTQVGDGNIRAIEGTRVTIRAEANQPIEFAYLEFDPLETAERDQTPVDARARVARDTIKMKHQETSAEVTFTLQLGADSKSSWHDRYRLRFTNASNETNEQPIVYDVHVIPDLVPQVDILTPEKRQLFVAEDQVQPIEVRALDPDFGLTEVELKFVRAGNSLAEIPLLETPTSAPVSLQYRLIPQQLGLHAGDSAVFWAVARDNRRDPLTRDPSPRESKTMEYELRVLAPVADKASDGEGQEGGRQRADDGQNLDEPPADRPEKAAPENEGNAEDPAEGPNADENQAGSPERNAGGNKGPESGSPSGANDASAANDGQTGSNSGSSGAQDGQQATAPGQEGASGKGGTSDGNTAENSAQQENPAADDPQENNAAEGNAADTAEGNNDRENNGTGANQESSAGAANGSEPTESGQGGQDAGAASSGGDNASSQTDRSGEGGRTDGNQPSGEAPRDGQATGQPGRGGPQVSDIPPTGADGPTGSADRGANAPRSPGANQSRNPDIQKQDPLSTDGARDGEAVKRIWDRMQEKGATPPDGNPGNTSKQPNAASEAGTHEKPGDTPDKNSSQTEDPAANPSAGSRPAQADKPPQASPPQPREPSTESQGESTPESGKGESPKPSGGSKGEEPATQGKGAQPTGEQPTGEQGTGEQETGEQPTGEQGTGEQETGEQGKGAGNEPPGTTSSTSEGTKGEGDAPGGREPGRTPGDAARSEGASGTPSGASPGAAAGGQSAGAGSSKPGQEAYPDDAPQEPSSNDEHPENSGRDDPRDGQTKPRAEGNESAGGAGATSQAGQGSRGNGEGTGDHGDAGEAAQEDEANLDYARRATDLVLDYLKHDENRADRELLDRLGWKREDLQEFVKRWEQLKQDARRPDVVGEASRRELDDALRGLGLAPAASRVQRAGTRTDRIEGVQNAGRNATAPSKYREQWQEFRKSISGAR